MEKWQGQEGEWVAQGFKGKGREACSRHAHRDGCTPVVHLHLPPPLSLPPPCPPSPLSPPPLCPPSRPPPPPNRVQDAVQSKFLVREALQPLLSLGGVRIESNVVITSDGR